jgi:hypothetical protein
MFQPLFSGKRFSRFRCRPSCNYPEKANDRFLIHYLSSQVQDGEKDARAIFREYTSALHTTRLKRAGNPLPVNELFLPVKRRRELIEMDRAKESLVVLCAKGRNIGLQAQSLPNDHRPSVDIVESNPIISINTYKFS